MKRNVFLSHSTVDFVVADEVRAALEANGITCWMAPRDSGVGDYGEAIVDAIEQADFVLVLLSQASNASIHVKNEVERATAKSKLVITFRIEDTIPSKRLELFLSSQQWIDGFDAPGRSRADCIRSVVGVIGEKLRGSMEEAGEAPTAQVIDLKSVSRLLYQHCWIGYDPTEFDPTLNPPVWPSSDSILKDLQRIAAAGFSGIVTYTCKGSLDAIPQYAKALGLAVIAGVWNPADEREFQIAAGLRDWVDGYCLGHNSLGKVYQKAILYSAIAEMRRITGRPVTTSEEMRIYRDEDRFCYCGDWLFPDCHISFRNRPGGVPTIDVGRCIEGCMRLAEEGAGFAKKCDRPVMLKMLTFPWAGAENASIENQSDFFSSLLEQVYDPEFGLSVRAAIMVNGAFDTPWKRGHPFYSWDPYTGVLERNGRPRPAVRAIIERIDQTL